MEDIGWDRREIDENGSTIEENSLIKAQAILSFCRTHSIDYPIMTDEYYITGCISTKQGSAEIIQKDEEYV